MGDYRTGIQKVGDVVGPLVRVAIVVPLLAIEAIGTLVIQALPALIGVGFLYLMFSVMC